jgi:hypothetical protein
MFSLHYVKLQCIQIKTPQKQNDVFLDLNYFHEDKFLFILKKFNKFVYNYNYLKLKLDSENRK